MEIEEWGLGEEPVEESAESADAGVGGEAEGVWVDLDADPLVRERKPQGAMSGGAPSPVTLPPVTLEEVVVLRYQLGLSVSLTYSLLTSSDLYLRHLTLLTLADRSLIWP